jgi:RHS repeat-associated protein
MHDANFNVTSIELYGTVQERFAYSAYGTRVVLNASWNATTDTKNWVVGPQGLRWDSAIGMFYVRNRWESPALMRFAQPESYGARYIDGMNLYPAFAANPINRVDPTGLDASPTFTSGLLHSDGTVSNGSSLSPSPSPSWYTEDQKRAALRTLGEAIARLERLGIADGVIASAPIRLVDLGYPENPTMGQVRTFDFNHIEIDLKFAAEGDVAAVAGILVHESGHAIVEKAGFCSWIGSMFAKVVPWGYDDLHQLRTLSEYYNHKMQSLVTAAVTDDIHRDRHIVGHTSVQVQLDGQTLWTIPP